MEEFTTLDESNVEKRQPRVFRALRTGEHSGQAVVEFALVSFAFFSIVFGTIDLGRAVYMYSQLTNAVREGARYGKIHPEQNAQIKQTVRDKAPSLGGADGGGVGLLTVNDAECTGGCYQGCSDVTVSAEYRFQPVVASFLGISSTIELRASARVEAE